MTVISNGFKEQTLRDNSASTEEDFDVVASTFSAVRTFEGPWVNRYAFLDDYLGISATALTNGTSFANLAVYPDNPIGYISRVKIKGRGKPDHNAVTAQASFERAVITVFYHSRSYNVDEGQDNEVDSWTKALYYEEETDSEIDMLSIPGKDIIKAGGVDKQHDNGPFDFPVITGTLIIRQHRILRPNWLAINLLHGHSNGWAFITPAGRVFQNESLRYDGVQSSYKINLITNGQQGQFSPPSWTLTHKFSYNARGWNNKPIDGVWEAFRMANGFRMFPDDDLYQLFFGIGGPTFNQGILNQINAQLQIILAEHEAGGNLNVPIVLNAQVLINTLIQSLGFN